MRAFFQTDAGKGTAGVFLTAIILVFPPVGTWLVAALTLTFAVRHLGESFRQVDAEAEATTDAAAAGESRLTLPR